MPVPLAPPGVSIVSNMAVASNHPGDYDWFYDQVRNGGPWDYKQRGPAFEDFGNYHFGAVGTAAAIPANVLLRAAGWAQKKAGTSKKKFGMWYGKSPYGDDPKDQAKIKEGIEFARSYGYGFAPTPSIIP